MGTVRSMVQGVEVWVPHGEVLRLDSAAFATPGEFSRKSAASFLRRGEGLPGGTWATGQPLHWRDLGVNFVHADWARAEGIDAAMAVPIFRAAEFVAALVFYLTQDATSAGCFERWTLDEARGVLRHAGGHYVACDELQRMSALLQFQRGVGLPGQVWSTRRPVLMADVGRASSFIRSALAAQFSLESGLGVPIFDARDVSGALTFLASSEEPFLRSVEVWRVTGTELQLVMAKGSATPIETTVVTGDMFVGRVAHAGKPTLLADSAGASPSASMTLGWPIFDAGALAMVACLKF